MPGMAVTFYFVSIVNFGHVVFILGLTVIITYMEFHVMFSEINKKTIQLHIQRCFFLSAK